MFAMQQSALPGMGDTPLPARLKDGETAHVWMFYSEIGQALKNAGRSVESLRPIAEDSAGNVYRGEPWTVDANEFIRMGKT